VQECGEERVVGSKQYVCPQLPNLDGFHLGSSNTAFGGNPNKVTTFGKSAGGQAVFAKLASPTAEGLLQRAIVESGSYGFETTSLASAEAGGVAFANTVGWANQIDACLRAVPTAVLNAASSLL